MSKFRVELDCAFITESDAVAFLNLLRDIQKKIYSGTEKVLPVYSGDEKTGWILETPGIAGDGIPTIAKCRYHECFHDENPPKPCGGYVNYDLKRPIVEPVADKLGTVHTADKLTKEG